MYKLTEPEITYIFEKIKQVNELEKTKQNLMVEISSLIQLICHQNNLKGDYQLDISSKSLIKKEE